MRFFFHYNKPLSIKRGKPTISLHFDKKCHFVDNIVCNVPTEGKINKNQPKFVIRGKAANIVIVDDIAKID